jgi:hypothetical protein
MRQAQLRDYYVVKMLFYFLSVLTILKYKNQNYKIIDLTDSYNFYIKCIFI